MTAQTILPANTLSSGGYNVANSCRFNDGDSPSMAKTPSGSGNRRTFTFSAWVKRSTLGSGVNVIFSAANSGNRDFIYFEGDALKVHKYNSGYDYKITTNRLFRDDSAWYHIVAAFDTTQGTASNRIKVYVNGVQETSLADSDYPSEDFDTNYNTVSLPQQIGKDWDASNYFDGYIAEVVMIDGSALAPTSFGEFDSDSPNIWKPIDVSGLTFGTNGFYLDFEDSSNLGNDANGGTDFTEANLAATDQSTDTCTNNHAVLFTFPGGNTNVDGRSEGNLISTSNNSQYAQPLSTIAMNSGKWYWEMKYTVLSGANTNSGMGIMESNTIWHAFYNTDAETFYYSTDGQKVDSGSASSYGNSQSAGDIVQCAFDATNGVIWFGKNGTWQNSATAGEIAAGTTTNAAFTNIPSGYYHAGFCDATASKSFTVEFNFGSPPFAISSGNADGDGYGNFEYAVPSGYYSLNTKNLAEYG